MCIRDSRASALEELPGGDGPVYYRGGMLYFSDPESNTIYKMKMCIRDRPMVIKSPEGKPPGIVCSCYSCFSAYVTGRSYPWRERMRCV